MENQPTLWETHRCALLTRQTLKQVYKSLVENPSIERIGSHQERARHMLDRWHAAEIVLHRLEDRLEASGARPEETARLQS